MKYKHFKCWLLQNRQGQGNFLVSVANTEIKDTFWGCRSVTNLLLTCYLDAREIDFFKISKSLKMEDPSFFGTYSKSSAL